jgi:hypothetical protein
MNRPVLIIDNTKPDLAQCIAEPEEVSDIDVFIELFGPALIRIGWAAFWIMVGVVGALAL